MMGNIDKYCPACGSQDIYTIEVYEQAPGDKKQLSEEFFECGDCDGTWEKHEHRVH